MPRTRTFIGIVLTKAIRDNLCELQDTLATVVPGVKWVEPENLHVTMLFLGEVDDRELPAICRAAQDAVTHVPAFPLSVERAGCFPNSRRPRVLWTGVGQGLQEVVAIHDKMEAKLLELGCYRREERKYTPHITLGRLRGEAPGDALARVLAKYQGWQAGDMSICEVHVMSSALGAHGPTYAVLSRARLA
jgi:2'-5' RNA ligase